jgi:protocatechuate 3,4-dioxygenase beta subunit
MSQHEHDRGLAADMLRIQAGTERRRFLKWLAALAIVPHALACDSASEASSSGDGSSDGGTSGSGSCTKIPEETAGPYPGDGSNGKNALTLSGIVRSDIRSSFAGATGTAEGVPLTVKLSVVSASDGCAPRAGYAVYLWHCDREGLYSMYSAGVTEENYLRGVQEADDDGTVTFTTIFPACYSGRWPHIHFEVYPGLDAATVSTNKLATSQIALPEDACNTVFATSGYSASVANLKQVSLATDNVFSDGVSLQTPTITGNATDGYTVTMTVAVAD